MKTILNVFFFLCAVFLVFSYEVMAGKPIDDNKKINPSYAQPLPIKNSINVYPKQLNAPELLSPRDNKIFSHYPRRIRLRWKSVSNAITYNVEIDCLGCCASGIWCADADRKYKFIEGLNNISYEFNFVGAHPGRWRVQAVDAYGKVGKQSPWFHFKFTR